MESFFGVLKSVVERGWRLGLALFLVGVVAPTLDYLDFPKPGALKKELIEYSTVCALIGAVVLVTSLVGAAGTWVRSLYQARAERRHEWNDALQNIQTLPKDQLSYLCSKLESPARFEVPDEHGLLVDMIRKKVLVTVGDSESGYICELHPAILAERRGLLPALKQARKATCAFPKVRRLAKGWTVTAN